MSITRSTVQYNGKDVPCIINKKFISSKTSNIEIDISAFNDDRDILKVYIGERLLKYGYDYMISSDKSSISNIKGYWNENNSGITVTFVLINYIDIPSIGDGTVGDGSININKLDTNLKNKINKIDTVSSQLDKTKSNLDCNTQNKPKPMFTLSMDDGWREDYDLVRPLLSSKNVPASICIVKKLADSSDTRYMRMNEIKELQDTFGWEILSHTMSHGQLDKMTYEEQENEIKGNLEYLKANGINVQGLVYPQGMYNTDTLTITRKYHDYGISVIDTFNTTPIDTFLIKRWSFGQLESNMNMDYWSKRIDEAILKGYYIVFMIHGFDFQGAYSQAHLNLLGQIVDYIKSKNVDIVNFRDAFKVLKNKIDIGDYLKGHFLVGADGKIKSDVLDNIPSKLISETITSETLITSFEKNKITVKTFKISDNSGFPKSAGTLETYRLGNDDWTSYQIWTAFDEPYNIYKRIWNVSSNGWGEFEIFSSQSKQAVIKKTSTGINVNSTPSSFPNLQTCIISFVGSDTSGFPDDGAGNLIVIKNHLNDELCQQIWIAEGKKNIRKREWNNGAWSNWSTYIDNINAQVTLTVSEIPSNGVTEFEFPFVGATNNKAIVMSPCYGAGGLKLLWNCYCETQDKIKLRIYNFGGSAVTPQSQWRVNLINH